MRSIILIAHDIRSCHNVGALLRTSDGLGVDVVYLTGYTPYPEADYDTRLPHIARKTAKDIHKTALGAENSIMWHYAEDVQAVLDDLSRRGYKLVALEQSSRSIRLPEYKPPDKIVILLGREVEGLDASLIAQCGTVLEIPMFGSKESFNVVHAAAMALYHCRFA